MASDFGSLPGYTIVSNAIMAKLEKKVNDLSVWTTDLSSEVAGGGETVTAHYVSTHPTVGTKDITGSYVSSDMVLTPVNVSLGQPIYAQVEVNEVDFVKVSSPGKLESTIAGAIATELSKKLEDTVMALITAGNFSASSNIGASSAFTFGKYRGLVAEGFKAGFPNPLIMLNSDYLAKIEDSAGFYGRTSNGNWDDGSKLIRSDRLPTTGNLVGVVADKSAIVIAGRTLGRNDVQVGRVDIKSTDSGLSIRYRMFEDPLSGKLYFRAETLFGAARGNPAGLVRATSA